MPKDITRAEVQALVAGGCQLVEVLPAEEFMDEHIPGAINIPLRYIDHEAPRRLDRNRGSSSTASTPPET